MQTVEKKLDALGCRYAIRRRRRAKRVILRFTPYGMLEVVVPNLTSGQFVVDTLTHYEPWISRQLDLYQAKQRVRPEIFSAVPACIELLCLQRSWILRKQQRYRDGYFKAGETLIEYQGNDVERLQRQLRGWLKRKARAYLHPLMDSLSRKTGLHFSKLSIRNQKTKWGSCSSRQHISLNQNLLFLPSPTVRYLCVHELCHTKFLHHRKPFWDLVSKHQPDYLELDRALNQRLWIPAWAGDKGA